VLTNPVIVPKVHVAIMRITFRPPPCQQCRARTIRIVGLRPPFFWLVHTGPSLSEYHCLVLKRNLPFSIDKRIRRAENHFCMFSQRQTPSH
jgi:hypothetical protein